MKATLIAAIATLFTSLVDGIAVPLGERPIHFGSVVRRDDPDAFNGAKPFGDTIKTRKLAKIKEIAPVSGLNGAKRIRFVYGPFRVKGPNDKSVIPNTFPSMDKGGTAYNFALDQDFPRDMTVLLATSALLKSDFSRATLDDKIYNHHNAFMEVVPKSDEIYECESGKVAKQPPTINLFAGTSTEKIEFNFTSAEPQKVQTGFYISKDSVLQNMLDLVNHGETREFYTENEIEFIPGRPAGFVNSKQTMINPDICGGPDGYALHPPAGQSKFSIKSEGVVMKTSGWLVRQRGHLHDGGSDITLTVNGKLVCQSKALYGGPGFEFKDASGKTIQTINKSTECTDPILLKTGDRLQIAANFDLDAHPSRPMGGGEGHAGMKRSVLDGSGDAEQMGVMFVYFAKLDN